MAEAERNIKHAYSHQQQREFGRNTKNLTEHTRAVQSIRAHASCGHATDEGNHR